MNLHDAVALLDRHGADARILAGGQSLIPLLAQRSVRTRLVIDINRIPNLDRIEIDRNHIRMGALVRQEEARLSRVVREEVCGLSQALEWVANAVVRERGTVIGNLVANSPGSELPSVAMALQAIFVVRDRAGERRVAAEELLGVRGKLATDAIVTHVLWPRSVGRGGFYEVARRDGHAAVVGAMVSVSRETCRIGLCGVLAVGTACPTVARAVFTRFPTAPEPQEIDERLVADLGESPGKPLAGNRCADAFASAGYRREIAPVVIQRAVMAAARASTA